MLASAPPMGYFVQVAGDSGAPLLQCARNYPEVSFASSALFHALVTASLENGFVPGIMRSKDAAIALAVHGCAGSRLSIALVTSEFPAGETRDVEAQLRWRLSVIHRAAFLVAGADLLRRQHPADCLRRLFAQRLAPVVNRCMAEEPAPGVVSRVPLVGLCTMGAAAEWLPACHDADAALERLVGSLPAGGGVVLAGLSPCAVEATLAVLSWQGRALAATTAWRRLESIDRALLLQLADQVGPPSFEQSSRSWSLAVMEGIWLPTACAGAADQCPQTDVAASGARASPSASPSASPNSSHAASRTPRRCHMVNVRLRPDLGPADLPQLGACACAAADIQIGVMSALFEGEPAPSAHEAASAWADDASVVFTVVEMEDDMGTLAGTGRRKPTTANDMLQSASLCGDALRGIWGDRLKQGLVLAPVSLPSGPCHAAAALLVDEATQDVVVAPPCWAITRNLPWRCPARHNKVRSLRKLLYWMHTLPCLSETTPQQYATCEDYAVGAVRREDGIQCWALICPRPRAAGDACGQAAPTLPAAMDAVEALMASVPVSGDLRRAFAGLVGLP